MAKDDPVTVAWQRCRAARSDVAVPLEAFRAHLTAHRGETSEREQLETWCLDDIYLACACVSGDPAAVRAAEAELVPIIDLALTGWDPAVVDETRQQLRAMLLVDHGDRGPLLAQYSGRGALRRWIRVVARREAGRIYAKDRAMTPVEDDQLFEVLVPSSDPAASAVKRDAAAAFKTAFLAALDGLDRRDRTLLRLHILDDLSIDEIAPLYRVHRATIARWIAAAKQLVMETTRKRLSQDLRIDRGEVDSLIRLVQSRIELVSDPLASKP